MPGRGRVEQCPRRRAGACPERNPEAGRARGAACFRSSTRNDSTDGNARAAPERRSPAGSGPVQDAQPAPEQAPAQNAEPSVEPAAPDEQEDLSVPIPGPLRSPNTTAEPSDEDADPGDGGMDDGEATRPHTDPNAPLPAIEYDLSKLPEPVRKTHELIVESREGRRDRTAAAASRARRRRHADLARGCDGDPIAFLKELSGDGDGYEVLAILEEVLGAGYVHVDVGTPEELYVWPYFFAIPLDRLDGKQKVELFKLVTAGDYEDMKTYGAYIFYRIGITPQGRWAFFVAGD